MSLESRQKVTLDTYKIALGKRIKEAAETIGGGAELSRRTGIPRSTLEYYFTGKTEPKLSQINDISLCTSTDIRWLATGEGYASPKIETEEEDCLSDEYIKKNFVRLDNVKAAALAYLLHIKKTKQKIPPEKAADIIVLLAQISEDDDSENVDETNLIRLMNLTR